MLKISSFCYNTFLKSSREISNNGRTIFNRYFVPCALQNCFQMFFWLNSYLRDFILRNRRQSSSSHSNPANLRAKCLCPKTPEIIVRKRWLLFALAPSLVEEFLSPKKVHSPGIQNVSKNYLLIVLGIDFNISINGVFPDAHTPPHTTTDDGKWLRAIIFAAAYLWAPSFNSWRSFWRLCTIYTTYIKQLSGQKRCDTTNYIFIRLSNVQL